MSDVTTFASILWLIVAVVLTVIVLARPGAATLGLAALFALLQARCKRDAPS